MLPEGLEHDFEDVLFVDRLINWSIKERIETYREIHWNAIPFHFLFCNVGKGCD